MHAFFIMSVLVFTDAQHDYMQPIIELQHEVDVLKREALFIRGELKRMQRNQKTLPDSAPPAIRYPKGDPWRNPTAKEMQEIYGDDDLSIGGPS